MANDWVALFATAQGLVERAGLDRDALRHGLLHLGRTALLRVALLPAQAPALAGLTVAVQRGDVATVGSHLRAVAAQPAGARLHAAASIVLAQALSDSGALDAATAAGVVGVCGAALRRT